MVAAPFARVVPQDVGGNAADAGGARFTLERYGSLGYNGYYYYTGPNDYPSVAERLADGTFLVPFSIGNVVTSVTPTGLSGTFLGGLGRWGTGFPTNISLVGTCNGFSQQFTLARQ